MERFLGMTRERGFYDVEWDVDGEFFWTRPQFTLIRQQAGRYFYTKFFYLGAAGTLTIQSSANGWRTEIPLQQGWQEVVIALPQAGQAGERLQFQVEPPMTASPDPREFGLRFRSWRGLESAEEFQRIDGRLSNARNNALEYSRGVSQLASTPTKLRIDMESRCNMMPRCVYCAWDYTKELEAKNTARHPFVPEFFDELGEYYENAQEVVNCGHGETLLSPHFSAVVERLHRDGKHFEFTTNGMLLDESVRAQLLGKDIFVFISLDAATAEGYARYRNDQFERITGNIRSLSRERANVGSLFPKIFVSFILMRSNLAEVDAFLSLCRELGVDAILFRTLNEYDNTLGQTVHRAGFDFCYAEERLTPPELAAAQERITAQNLQWGMTVIFLLDEQASGSDGPCPELWQSLYALQRGFLPCCFAREPILTELPDSALPLREQVRYFLNSPQAQAMRSELAAGSIPAYCRAVACPYLNPACRP
jgi:MoaA/NifB/PqqE/SkfB family radical SAM enzyme